MMKGPFFPRARWSAFLVFTVVLLFSGASLSAKPKAKILDLNDTVATSRILSQFATLVQGSGLGSFLSSRGPFILFVPTNSAFSKIPPGTLAALLRPENRELLQRIVLFHIVNGNRYTAKDLIPLKSLLSCEGNPLPLHVNRSGAQTVAKARILHADIRCANGLLDEIDTLLLPPGAVLPAPVATPVDLTTGTPITGAPVPDTTPAVSPH